jgi:phosphatidate phosphatase LPIN
LLWDLYKRGVLQEGANDVKYENNYLKKGRTKTRFASGSIFLWSTSDLLVVSDIDGTITKSDVVGLLDSIAVESYGHTHSGVCRFFNEIERRENVR